MSSIRRQLTRRLLVGFAVPILVGGLGVFVVIRQSIVAQFDSGLRAKAMAIASVTRPRGGQVEVDSSERFMREFDADPRQEREEEERHLEPPGFFQIRAMDGRSLERSESLGGSDLPFFHGTLERPEFRNAVLPSGSAGRIVGLAFQVRGPRGESRLAEPGEVVLTVASDRRDLDRTLATLGFLLSGCGILLLAATSAVVPRVLRRELAPLDALADQAAAIDADSLALRFPTEALPIELAPISQRLNALLSRLEQSFERERQFSADLAHELRTPIAELRSLAELALKWPESRPVATDSQALEIAVQMEGIVTRLLELLRSERGLLLVHRERVALAPMLTGVWRPAADRAAAKRLNVTWDVGSDIQIDADPVMLRSILANLVENAVEYTPEEGSIRISGSTAADRFSVCVTNTAPGLRAEHLPKFFDRFWRQDGARSSGEHSGLGLSLARAFAQLLAFDLTASLGDEKSVTLTLSGPAREAQ